VVKALNINVHQRDDGSNGEAGQRRGWWMGVKPVWEPNKSERQTNVEIKKIQKNRDFGDWVLADGHQPDWPSPHQRWGVKDS
jgi:hypothetical protein